MHFTPFPLYFTFQQAFVSVIPKTKSGPLTQDNEIH